MGEPDCIRTYNKRFIKQFANVVGIQKKNYDVPKLIRNYWAMWFVGLSFETGIQKTNSKYDYDNLLNMDVPKKEKLISVVSSNKNFCEGHKKRLEFVERLKRHFGEKIDVYGRGINPFDDKADVLVSYKYHIAIENNVQDDYITEKLLDPFLTYTYPIYHGAKNANEYFCDNLFTTIDINQPEKSIKIIEDVINSGKYEMSLKYLIESRDKVLNEYNLFDKMAVIANQQESSNYIKTYVELNPESYYNYKRRLRKKY